MSGRKAGTLRRSARGGRQRSSSSGQALVEFGLVIGLFMLVIGGLVQFGIILWSQNAITEISRNTARWAVTQSTTCDTSVLRAAVASKANQLASGASLVSYTSGMWPSAQSLSSTTDEGVLVDWQGDSPFPQSDCPPSDATHVWTIRVRVNHVVPIFIPGLSVFAPPCTSSGFCLSTTTELRMEPKKP